MTARRGAGMMRGERQVRGSWPGRFPAVRWLVLVGGVGLLWGVGAGGVRGDDTRYQLGKRVQRFERRFEGTNDAERGRTLPFLKEAVTAFFGFDLPRAGRALDRASQVLDSEPELGAEERRLVTGLLAVNLSFARRGVVLGAGTWPGELRLGYAISEPLPAVTLMLRVGEGAEQEWRFEQLPGKFAGDLAGLPAGDHEVRGEVRVGDVRVRLPMQRVSLIADAEARLKALEERLGREGEERGEPTAAGGATVVATLKESQRLVRRLLE
ncbi:MAG: hypothetical protein ACKO3P_13290, partial [Planctomycetaceae bacterium]